MLFLLFRKINVWDLIMIRSSKQVSELQFRTLHNNVCKCDVKIIRNL